MAVFKPRQVMRDFPWIHLVIGAFGNTTFFVGSIFFFWESTKAAGIWLFILGSFGMLVGSLGEAFVRHERHKYPRIAEDVDGDAGG